MITLSSHCLFGLDGTIDEYNEENNKNNIKRDTILQLCNGDVGVFINDVFYFKNYKIDYEKTQSKYLLNRMFFQEDKDKLAVERIIKRIATSLDDMMDNKIHPTDTVFWQRIHNLNEDTVYNFDSPFTATLCDCDFYKKYHRVNGVFIEIKDLMCLK